MSFNQLVEINYLLLWGAARVRGCFRRWQQPVLRGPEWFFNVQVQPGFYTGPGKKLLNRYRMRMLMPSAVEIPIAAAILISGHVQNLVWLILGMSVFVHVNHLFSVDLKERQARAFAVAEAEEPVPAMVLSLKTRRLSDYSNRRLDRLLALASIAAIAWVVRYYFQAAGHHDWRIFLVPAVVLYLEGALLFTKHVILAWRTPVPQAQAEEYVNAREEARKFYFTVCDLNRIPNISMLIVFPFLLKMSPANAQRVVTIWVAAWLAITAVVIVWGEIRRKQVLAVALRARPMRFPDLLGMAAAPSWPICYEPSAPTLVLKGARGYSLNFANTLAQLGALYFAAGLALFMVVWRMGH
jgi:hypothetical protein